MAGSGTGNAGLAALVQRAEADREPAPTTTPDPLTATWDVLKLLPAAGWTALTSIATTGVGPAGLEAQIDAVWQAAHSRLDRMRERRGGAMTKEDWLNWAVSVGFDVFSATKAAEALFDQYLSGDPLPWTERCQMIADVLATSTVQAIAVAAGKAAGNVGARPTAGIRPTAGTRTARAAGSPDPMLVPLDHPLQPPAPALRPASRSGVIEGELRPVGLLPAWTPETAPAADEHLLWVCESSPANEPAEYDLPMVVGGEDFGDQTVAASDDDTSSRSSRRSFRVVKGGRSGSAVSRPLSPTPQTHRQVTNNIAKILAEQQARAAETAGPQNQNSARSNELGDDFLRMIDEYNGQVSAPPPPVTQPATPDRTDFPLIPSETFQGYEISVRTCRQFDEPFGIGVVDRSTQVELSATNDATGDTISFPITYSPPNRYRKGPELTLGAAGATWSRPGGPVRQLPTNQTALIARMVELGWQQLISAFIEVLDSLPDDVTAQVFGTRPRTVTLRPGRDRVNPDRIRLQVYELLREATGRGATLSLADACTQVLEQLPEFTALQQWADSDSIRGRARVVVRTGSPEAGADPLRVILPDGQGLKMTIALDYQDR